MADTLIYLQKQDGSFVKINNPMIESSRNNFLILYQGMDWSGFRTLEGCEKQLPSIASRGKNEYFTVVERL